MGHSWREANIKYNKNMGDPGYGNTKEFAARVLTEHWAKEHDANAGKEGRPYECGVCQGLWIRLSNTLCKELGDDRATPYPYLLCVKAAIATVAVNLDASSRQELLRELLLAPPTASSASHLPPPHNRPVSKRPKSVKTSVNGTSRD